MQANDSQPPSKDIPSSPSMSPAERFKAELIKPSRQKNLTPSERASLAAGYRRLRKALRSCKDLEELDSWGITADPMRSRT